MAEKKKTAFVLGGGGARGAYEIGVWQALRETDIRPDMIAGCSVGAINGALIAQDDFDLAVRLWKEIQTDMIVDKSFPRKKDSPLKKLLDRYLDEPKIRAGGTEFGIVTVELPNLTPRYFFLEDIGQGKLIDFILASASLFPAFKAADIDDAKYVDGGYLDNLPVGMALKRGATKIIAVDLETSGLVQKEALKQADDLTMIRCKWDLGNILVFDGKSSEKNLRLGYLDTLKVFGFFDGNHYTFSKGEYSKRMLEPAEAAARIFELDPAYIYTKSSFKRRLSEAVLSYRKETEAEIHSFRDQLKARSLDKELLLSLLKKINQRSITLVIADHLQGDAEASEKLMRKSLSLLFKDENLAASYLIKDGII
jgi:hypothetical protein